MTAPPPPVALKEETRALGRELAELAALAGAGVPWTIVQGDRAMKLLLLLNAASIAARWRVQIGGMTQ